MNRKSTFSTPCNRSVAGVGLTSPHTHMKQREDQLSVEGSASPRLPRYPRLSRNIPTSLNKRTKWQEVIRDTAGLKIDFVLTERAVFHDLCIALLVYTLSSGG